MKDQSAVRRFLEEGDERRMRKADERRRRREARRRQEARRDPRPLPEDPEERDELLSKIVFAEKARENHRRTVESRLRDGYVWCGGYVNDQWQEAFRYQGLRSEDHPLLKAFVMRTPRVKKGLKTGYDKAVAEDGDSKVIMLDEPYVSDHGTQRGWLRQDLDTEWPSWAHLRQALLDTDIPLPHFGVAYVRPCGTIVRPQLIWLLDNPVRRDAKALKGPQALCFGVARGICQKLISLGGDPGGLINGARVKNPLSPHWGVAILNEDAPFSLAELADYVDPYVSLDDLEKDAAVEYAAAADVDRCRSNAAFRAFRNAAFETLRMWWRAGVINDLDDREALRGRLTDALGPKARRALNNGKAPKVAMGLLRRVAGYAARSFDPSLVGKAFRENRGILREELNAAGIHDVKGRQSGGQAYTSKVRRSRTVAALVAAMEALGGPEAASKAEISRKSGIPYSTLMRRWSDAVKAFEGQEAGRRPESLIGSIVRTPGGNPAGKEARSNPPSCRSIPAFLARPGRETILITHTLAEDPMALKIRPLPSRRNPAPYPNPSSTDTDDVAQRPAPSSSSRRHGCLPMPGKTALPQAGKMAHAEPEARPALRPSVPAFLRKGKRFATAEELLAMNRQRFGALDMTMHKRQERSPFSPPTGPSRSAASCGVLPTAGESSADPMAGLTQVRIGETHES